MGSKASAATRSYCRSLARALARIGRHPSFPFCISRQAPAGTPSKPASGHVCDRRIKHHAFLKHMAR
jgi:hypothetical protein